MPRNKKGKRKKMASKEFMVERLVKSFNRAHGTRCKWTSDSTRMIVEEALAVGGEQAFINREIANFVANPDFTDLKTAFRAYIEWKGSESPAESPALILDESEYKDDSVDPTPSARPNSNQTVGNALGVIERAVAEVIVNSQGMNIAERIVGDMSQRIDRYVRENYGTIQRKVELQIEDRQVEFEERLHGKFETVLKFVKMNEPVFLTGPAGCGKNVICKQVAKALGIPFYFSNAVTQEYKITGFTDANGNFHETQFYKAFKNGGLFMLDEIDASIPDVLVILNAAIANRYFDFPAPIGYVEAHPDFRVIAAGNTFGLGADYDYCGRNQLDMASLDRFALIRIDYDRDIELSVADGNAELVDFADDFRRAAGESGVRTIVSYRAISRMNKMLQLMDIKEVLETCLLKNLQKDDINMICRALKVRGIYKNALEDIIGGR